MKTIEGFSSNLMKYHDNLADLKSYFDGHKGDDNFEQEILNSMYTYITLST